MKDSFHHFLFRLVARYTGCDRKFQNAYSITFGVKDNHISKYAKQHSPFHEYLQHKLFKLADIFNTHALQLHDLGEIICSQSSSLRKKTNLTKCIQTPVISFKSIFSVGQ